MIGFKIGIADGSKLGSNERTELCSLIGSSEGSRYGSLDGISLVQETINANGLFRWNFHEGPKDENFNGLINGTSYFPSVRSKDFKLSGLLNGISLKIESVRDRHREL